MWFASMPVTTPTSKNYNKKKKQSTFNEAQHVSFSYIVLMRPRNVETMKASSKNRQEKVFEHNDFLAQYDKNC